MNETEIWLSCKDDLVRYAAALVGPGDAEDVVSTVFVRVLASRKLTGLDDARPYLFRAALNESRTRLGRRNRTTSLADLPEPAPSEPQPEVLQAVLALPVGQRAATFLVYWADMSVSETARLMGTRPGTVKRYLHLARSKLKGVLDEPIHTDR